MRKILILISMILLLNLVNALTLSQTSISIIAQKDVEKKVYLNISNFNSHDLFNITIEAPNYISFDNLDELKINTTEQIELRILKNELGSFTNNIKFIGFKKINCSELGTQIHNVDLVGFGIMNKLDICKGDGIKFKNLFDIPLPLEVWKGTGELIDKTTIDVNSSRTIYFNENGNYYYFWLSLLFLSSDVEVSDTASLVHSADDDVSLTLNLNVIGENTTLTISLSKINFTIDAESYESSYLVIENNGDSEAFNIDVFGDWITVEGNNFNLLAGQVKAVNFAIHPNIAETSQTDKIYTKSIKIKADNVDEISKDITVYIPYKEIGFTNGTSGWWINKLAFCNEFPTSQWCLTEPLIIFRNQTSYSSPDINFTLSSDIFQQLIIDFLSQKNEREISDNYRKLSDDAINKNISNIDNKLLDNKNEMDNISSEIKDLRSIIVIAFSLVLFVSFAAGAFYFGFNIYKRKKFEKAQSF